MLDIKEALSQFPQCKKVIVLAVKNECKELLFVLDQQHHGEVSIECVNLTQKEKEQFEFTFSEEQNTTIVLSEAEAYLYDPNVAILKAGAFKCIAEKYNLKKLGVNTHLYTSNDLLNEFPGRIFKVIESVNLKKQKIKKANVITKNYILNANQLKAKYKIQEGGDEFLIGLKDHQNKPQTYRCSMV